ncbi:hypothetical protein C8A00DRAFT_39968 [Chaetomidium leptoderma]|uniref:Exonuclease 1 n=1 Tax=Chaetomidium leptoderma TaxID=669021 RepID=A0AAN7A174_9PEZI|nr:hypothetical protein C8A00DRAFT_39968 [Chaetomidium leptoderma]
MGISGLLPLLKSIHRPTELKKYAGETFGIDGYGWLHRGAVACAIELAQGKPTRKYVDFAMNRVRMFKYFGVTPYLVFDGDFLPSKAKTEDSRAKRREESKKIGLELLRAGKPAQAHSELQKAIDVTPEMARHLIEELKKAEVPYVVAPYEADSQLVYLERQGLISGIVSEDSDLLVFGAKRLLTKMDQHGQCIEINRRDFCAVREVSLTGWTDNEFRHMAIFSGCDYLDGVNNVGLKTAYRLIRKHKTPERVIKMLRFDGKHRVPESYSEDFKQAELTFLHQRVFCPKKQDIVFLTEPEPTVNVEEMPFIGAPVETGLARAIAAGDINPITKERILVPRSPGKRRISQALAPVSGPPRSLGKPISEYFKDRNDARRIPLGEMDANCFAVEPDHNGTTTATDGAPRPIVFPLPRPYVEGAEEASASPARPYTNSARVLRRQSEPISKLLGLDFSDSSANRRRTAGPAIQVYQDPTNSTRPPKKARLCEDSGVDEVVAATPEKSKFFSSTKQKRPVKKKVDQFLMLDDSIDEALQSLPDLDSWRSGKPVESADEISIFQEPSPQKRRETAAHVESPTERHGDDADGVVEVPASSPVQHGPTEGRNNARSPTAVTPLGERLKGFSYETARPPRTRVVHGLPTPASSMQQTATPKSISPANTQTPMLTPLQRIGARALRRGKSRPTTSTPPTPLSSNASKDFDSLPVNPAFVPLPKVDLEEVEALNRSLGSEDQIIPESDGENDALDDGPAGCIWWRSVRSMTRVRRLILVYLCQDRLRDHAKAFDGLLSLIPAKMYYGEDTSDQWRKKKQTKDEARAAKRGKLDPDSELNRNAKEVLDERARNKRKLREMEAEEESEAESEQDDASDISGIERERPGEGLKKKKLKLDDGEPEQEQEEEPAPKQKKVVEEPSQDAAETSVNKKLKAKEEKKLAKKQKKEEAKKGGKAAKVDVESEAEEPTTEEAPVQPSAEADSDDEDMVPIDVSGLANEDEGTSAGSSVDSAPDSPVFDTTKNPSIEPASTTTSISSTVPPSEKPKYIKIPADTTALRARLEVKLAALRASRKADDSEGKPIRTRQDLLDSRREKQAQRKEHKKKMRQLAKDEEDRKREEALASARNSPGLSPLFEQDDDRSANHFAFGRLAFSDGTQLSHDLSYEKSAGSAAKRKGASDPKTALLKLEAQKKRIEGMDDDKRKEVLEKETWLAARKRAEGQKVHDNESLLKKALKRKDKAKKKSDREWKERADSVKTSIYERQKKREDNLRKRRDEKASGKGGKKKNKGVVTKKKNRPGFEGGFGGGKK